ncbi:hypothetical protein BU25DRAFT_489983 [Macroventuria anomochaeta]|uniref:Uncharacterized protein n=1 Tax=Macroventuria anomochaeta TaxID=301207 RepID=A0ACB6S5F7_9PLEO|nr:uncharacterized protein BU25DRAFT_489983 [Macroventuria anomochaeta]KAF2629416.1 hypothetical protein BU25DRAFT_489983 [Macroventuria anomochaeta]
MAGSWLSETVALEEASATLTWLPVCVTTLLPSRLTPDTTPTTGNSTWAYSQPSRVENWGHLAMHGSVVRKEITAAYYKLNATQSYYFGCSTGGCQGLKEAKFYPEDFGGIVAGAPAWWANHLQPWTVRIAL